jgi:hypothetical protein
MELIGVSGSVGGSSQGMFRVVGNGQTSVPNLGELADAMHPDDDDYADLRAALQRAVTILILEEGQR